MSTLQSNTELPWAFSVMPQIKSQIGRRRPGFFLDLDGTLAPIALLPDLALLPPETRNLLDGLARHHLVCIVSGRGLRDLRDKVALDNVYYAADHGHRIEGPSGSGIHLEVGAEYREMLGKAADAIRTRLAPLKGWLVEDKGLSVSVHYRLVSEAERPAVEQAVDGIASKFPGLRMTAGKFVHEFRPPGDWDKGQAVLWLLKRLRLGPESTCPVCVGDDLTDEDMFAAVAGWGIAVIVGNRKRSTGACCRLHGHKEVARLIRVLASEVDDYSAGISG